MGAFRWIRQFDQKGGGDNMFSIGIDVHKVKCVATIKNESRKKLEQSSFDNTTTGIMSFIKHVKKTYGKDTQAVCESTANYWMIRLHDTLEDNGIDTILAHSAKTKDNCTGKTQKLQT